MDTGRAIVSTTVEAVIIRADGTREDLGVIDYWHQNPLKRLEWKVKCIAKGVLTWLQK